MAKLPYIELSNGLRIPILHEDRNVIAIDKPQGWMLAPVSWQSTGRNLAAALSSSVNAGDFWARSRDLKFLRFVHRLDADTSGVLLLVKSPGAMPAYTELFEERKVTKVYLAVVHGVPEVDAWKCRLRLAPMQDRPGRMEINNAQGKDTETVFRVVEQGGKSALVMCWPLTGRTHQIRLHLEAAGHPIVGDELYGPVPAVTGEKIELELALRAIRLSYRDPFTATEVEIQADTATFVKLHGFSPDSEALRDTAPPAKVGEHPKAQLVLKARSEQPGRASQRHFVRREGFAPRRDWQEDEDSGAFQSDTRQAPFRAKRPAQRGFDRGPRSRSGFGEQRSFGGPRSFERREGGFADRPPRRPGFGKKPFGEQGGFSRPQGGFARRGPREFGAAEGPGGRHSKPEYGRPYEDRGERRPFGPGRGQDRERGSRWDRGEREERRGGGVPGPGVFPSSAKQGLKAGFQQSGGFGGSSERRPFRSGMAERSFHSGGGERPFRPRHGEGPREGARPPGKFGGGGFGRKPFGKAGGGKPGWGHKHSGRPQKKFPGPR